MKKQNSRNQHGNMLVLITAFTITIILALLFFSMSFVRLTGSQFEQKTAIEAAALAAARELSNIVITTDDFGYVGLSDSAPVGTDTQAGDAYYTQVHSINTLLGTTMLDYIIADVLPNNADLENLALADMAKAKAAQILLKQELQNAILPGGSALDKDGRTIRPYIAAENAYKNNQIRLTGKSTYKPNSLQLSLGVVPGLSTNIPTPKGWAGNFGSAQKAGFYLSYRPATYKGQTIVMSGIGDSLRLVDVKNWTSTVPNGSIPTIVRAEAVQDMDDNGVVRSIKTAAAAQPASVYDPKPCPGALVISFPDGAPDGTCTQNNIADLYGTCLKDGDDDSDVYMAQNGDYPVDAGSLMVADTNWPIPGDTQKQAGNACKIAVYDWMKRAGTKASVSSVVNMHNTPFNAANPATVVWPPAGVPGAKPVPNGVAHIFRFTPTGLVSYQSKQQEPAPFYIVSDQQMLVESFEVLTNGAANTIQIKPIDLGPPIMDAAGEIQFLKKYDLFIRDYARRPGKLKGGKHAGEPMDDPLVSYKDQQPKIALANNASGFASGEKFSYMGLGAKSKGNGGGGGSGSLPLILPQEDFAFYWDGAAMQILRDPAVYKQYQPGSGLRSTYRVNGIVCDIKFRRQLKVKNQDTIVEVPVNDPITGTQVIDPVTGLGQTTTTVVPGVKNDIGYVGLK